MVKRGGVMLMHPWKRNTLHIVENEDRPFADGGYLCNACHIHHRFKTTHLWLDMTGACIVAVPILAEIRRAGDRAMKVFSYVADPPTLEIGQKTREEQDNKNRRILVLPSIKKLVTPKKARKSGKKKKRASS